MVVVLLAVALAVMAVEISESAGCALTPNNTVHVTKLPDIVPRYPRQSMGAQLDKFLKVHEVVCRAYVQAKGLRTQRKQGHGGAHIE